MLTPFQRSLFLDDKMRETENKTYPLVSCYFSAIFHSPQDAYEEEEKEEDIDPVGLAKYHY